MRFPGWSVALFVNLVVMGLVCCADQHEPLKNLRLDSARAITDDLMLVHCDRSEGYYVVRSLAPFDDDGLLDGAVTKIGWNERYLWAERRATFRADRDGWMIVDCQQHLVLGPYSEGAFAERSKSLGDSGNSVESMAPEEAWKRLKKVSE